MTLQKKIENAINGVSRENVSNTPDFILAEYLMACLVAYENLHIRRENWFRIPGPVGNPLPPPPDPATAGSTNPGPPENAPVATPYYVTIPVTTLQNILLELEDAKRPRVEFGNPEDMAAEAYSLRGVAIDSVAGKLSRLIPLTFPDDPEVGRWPRTRWS